MNRRRRRLLVRFLIAASAFGGVFAVLAAVHEYSRTRWVLDELRHGDARGWTANFYFFNEAGNGIKFFLTADERYMRHYPSVPHIVAARISAARARDWQAQVRLANMYYSGEYVPQSRAGALLWLARAIQNAPPNRRAEIQRMINRVQADDGDAL